MTTTTRENKKPIAHRIYINMSLCGDKDKAHDREIEATETINCWRCKKDFIIYTTFYRLTEDLYNEAKKRQAEGLNPPFDNGSDMHLEKYRGLCGDCLEGAYLYYKDKDESTLQWKDRQFRALLMYQREGEKEEAKREK